MARFRNDAKGARTVRLTTGGYRLVEPGGTAQVDRHLVKRAGPGLVEVEDPDELPPVPDELAARFDHDGNGQVGGSLPQDPPALTGKNKAELLDIAEAEGVAVEDGATNAQIREAIEAVREG